MKIDLPTDDSGCGNIAIMSNGVYVRVEFEFWNENEQRNEVGTILFDACIAYRFRDEMHSGGFAEGSYDAIVEVQVSSWWYGLKAMEPPGLSRMADGPMRHFAVLFSNNGYLEALAQQIEILPSRAGCLNSL
jgi:hypothetical protein